MESGRLNSDETSPIIDTVTDVNGNVWEIEVVPGDEEDLMDIFVDIVRNHYL